MSLLSKIKTIGRKTVTVTNEADKYLKVADTFGVPFAGPVSRVIGIVKRVESAGEKYDGTSAEEIKALMEAVVELAGRVESLEEQVQILQAR